MTTLVMDLGQALADFTVACYRCCALDRINSAHTGFSSIWGGFLPTFKILLV